jgi:hypothetical protein
MSILTDSPTESTQPSTSYSLGLFTERTPGDWKRFNVILIFAATTMNVTVVIYDKNGQLQSSRNYTQPVQLNYQKVDFQKITWSDPSGAYNVYVTTQTIHFSDPTEWENAVSSEDSKAPPNSYVQVNGTVSTDVKTQEAGLAQDATFKHTSKYSEINQSITQGQNIF